MNQIRNSVLLIGNLGKDPEVKTFDNGNTLTKVSLATNEIFRDSNGDKRTETQWHNLVGWGKTAERMGGLLTKGKEIAVRGKLVHRDYQDKDGNKRYATEVVVNEFVLLGSKPAESKSA